MVSLLTAPVARDWLCRLLAALLFCLRPGSAADRLRALAEASGETAGRSLSRLAFHVGALNREPKIKSVLVVAPKSVIHVWKLELSRWLSRPLSVGLASASKGLPKEPTQILLINYDIVRKHREELDALAPWDVLVC